MIHVVVVNHAGMLQRGRRLLAAESEAALGGVLVPGLLQRGRRLLAAESHETLETLLEAA